MNIKKILITASASAVMLGAMAIPVFAASPFKADLSANNWRIFNVKPGASSFWDINKAQPINGGGVTFPIQKFVDQNSGSFTVYLLDNYNADLTGKTITANVNWTSGAYGTRSTVFPGAYVRIEFQDVASGPYDSNDYWWSTGIAPPLALNLNTQSNGQLIASLSDRAQWTNQAGKSANDTTANWQDWTGATVAASPYDGFDNAMKKVKQVSLSFGSEGSYASGVAAMNTDSAVFNMTSFTVGP